MHGNLVIIFYQATAVLEGCITLSLHSLPDSVYPWRVLRCTGDQQMGETHTEKGTRWKVRRGRSTNHVHGTHTHTPRPTRTRARPRHSVPGKDKDTVSPHPHVTTHMPTIQETPVQFLGWEDLLEKG